MKIFPYLIGPILLITAFILSFINTSHTTNILVNNYTIKDIKEYGDTYILSIDQKIKIIHKWSGSDYSYKELEGYCNKETIHLIIIDGGYTLETLEKLGVTIK